MREHVEPTARIQYVVESGGATPNVAPDYARLAWFIRDVDRTRVAATTRWARELADGAALGTQTRAEFTFAFGLYDLLPNTPLVERLYAHLHAVGVPAWTEDEQTFERECQRTFGVPEAGGVRKGKRDALPHYGRCTVPSRSRTGGLAPLSGWAG